MNRLRTVYPIKIVSSERVENAQALLEKKDLQINLTSSGMACAEGGGYIIFDFGKEMCGGVRILVGAIEEKHSRIRIRFGESLTEACSQLGEKGACNDHSIRDFIQPISFWSDFRVGNTGYRFVRLDFLGEKPVCLKAVVGTNSMYSKKAEYTYRGKDPTVKKIFTAAKRTMDLCVQNGHIWDGVKRDRLVWVGDMHPEMLALTTLYGRVEEFERSLDFLRRTTPLDEWMNGIATYSMWWVIIVADYFKATACHDFIGPQLDYIQALIERLDGTEDENGAFDYPSILVDWPTRHTEDEPTGVRAILTLAAQRAAEVLTQFDMDASHANSLLAKVRRVPLTVKKQKQVIALKYLAEGRIDDGDYAKLTAGGAEGMSTFMSYYVLSAIASRDEGLAVEIMKEYYGAMLKKGATTFWEDFEIGWSAGSGRIDAFPKEGQRDIHGDYGKYCYTGFRHSLCHGWSSGVIKFIKEHC